MYSLVTEQNIDILCDYAESTPDGAFVEIGVYKGGTAYRLNEIAKKQDRELYLYDTFTGLPFKGEFDSMPVGEFSDTSMEAVKELIPEAYIIQGVFPDSLYPMPSVAFVHADCDQYESVKAVCEVMPAFMVDGGIIYFDDYGCLEGATKAVDEYGGAEVIENGKAIMRINRSL